uniref:WSC domain protein pullulanase n=1 Tax=Aureobasidium pullulans TaxID=5580 RepID=I2BF43_AURPU|nr:WSC domain protein pullulanase [Aureobasidium pullulans]
MLAASVDHAGLEDNGTFNYQSKGHCQETCIGVGATVMAMTDGNDCWCGSTLPAKSSLQSDDSKCSTSCVGYPDDMCKLRPDNNAHFIYLVKLIVCRSQVFCLLFLRVHFQFVDQPYFEHFSYTGRISNVIILLVLHPSSHSHLEISSYCWLQKTLSIGFNGVSPRFPVTTYSSPSRPSIRSIPEEPSRPPLMNGA